MQDLIEHNKPQEDIREASLRTLHSGDVLRAHKF